MTKKTKRWLFYSAIGVFLLLSYVVLLYAQGYKYSFSEGKFLRTGAIALKVNIGARVLLNNKLEGNTSFFNSSFSVDRLLPGIYQLSINKDDYSDWSKTVIVEEGLVADFPNILLLPEEGEEEQKLFDEVNILFKELKPIPTLKPTPPPHRVGPTPQILPEAREEPFILELKTRKLYQNIDQELQEIASDVAGFRLSENKNKLAWWTSNELWVLWLSDQNYQPFHKKGEKELITRFQIPIQNGTWFRGEDHLILELEQHDTKDRLYSIYRLIEIDKRGGVNIVEL